MSSVHLKQAVNIAERITKENGFTSLPVNPISIAEKNGIHVKSANLGDGFAGCLIKQGDTFGILYSNSIANRGFQNFTVAHELGHYFLEGHVEKLFKPGITKHLSRLPFQSKDPIEEEADRFAASLLMPDGLFRKAMASIQGHGLDTVVALQNLCETSITATALRYSELAPFPSAVIMSSGRTIEYCILSPELYDSIRDRIRKGEGIPSGSETFKFNKNESNIKECVKGEGSGYLSDWFPNAPSHEILEDVLGLGIYGKTLTFLFAPDGFPEPDSN